MIEAILHSVVEAILGQVDWIDADRGYCSCPGDSLHTTKTRPRDCQVILSGVPTVFCFHSSCRVQVERATRELRSIAGDSQLKLQAGLRRPLQTASGTGRRRDAAALDHLRQRAEISFPQILAEHACKVADLFEQSPVKLLDDPAYDWRLLLQLFEPEDTIWIGDLYDSGPGHEANFQTMAAWFVRQKAPAAFTCPCTFQPGASSRSKECVKVRRFLVAESDTLGRNEIAAVFSWMRQFLRLRAVVNTAGKSLHGWFEYPVSDAVLDELKIILPALGCDPALFKPSQPCRLPGARRGDKVQALLWLDLTK